MTSILGVRTRGFLLFGAVATGLTACGAATPHDARPASAPGAARPAPAVAATRNGPVDQPSDRSADNSADKGWKLVRSPSAKKDGLDAFEGVENRGDGKRIFTQDNDFRFEMKVDDRDGDDRQRNEVKGMRVDGRNLEIGKGQTWRFTYKMFIPDSLRATTSFTHIMQMKKPGQGSAPILTLDLRRRGDDNRL